MVWTPITKGYCSLHDLRTIYTLDDVADMHEVIAELMIQEQEQNANR